MPHTADVILEAWGADFTACCEQAVAALVGIYADADAAKTVRTLSVNIEADTDEALLLDLLEEVIFILDTAGDIPVAAAVRTSDGGGFDVDLRLCALESIESTGSVPKAIARSELAIERTEDRVLCRFLVDV